MNINNYFPLTQGFWLEDKRNNPIVSFSRVGDKVQVLENCDNHYMDLLNKSDMKILIQLLTDMMNEMMESE